jgi:hypothetical protein
MNLEPWLSCQKHARKYFPLDSIQFGDIITINGYEFQVDHMDYLFPIHPRYGSTRDITLTLTRAEGL